MKKRKLKSRNPIAKAVRKLGVKIVPDKRRKAREKTLDELTKEGQRLELYTNEMLNEAGSWSRSHGCPPGQRFKIISENNSGIGLAIKVQCDCGQEKDLTNYGEW